MAGGSARRWSRVLRNLGFLLFPLLRSVWIAGSRPEHFEKVFPEVDRILQEHPGVPLVLTGPEPSVARWLKAHYPTDFHVPVPAPGGAGRFLRVLQPLVTIVLGAEENPRLGHLVRRLRRRGATVLASSADPATVAAAVREALSRVPPGIGRDSYQKPNVLMRFTSFPVVRALTWLLPYREFRTWDELAERLGRPRTIICLGNGPSSREATLALDASTCLLRVNWSWRRESHQPTPHVVFVADTRLPREDVPAVLGFRTRREVAYCLWRQLARRYFRRFEVFALDQLPSALHERPWPARPTSGIVMLAAAVALEPERLVIAGIDLYLHPDGRYPNDHVGLNAYSRVHDRAVEVAMIRHLLGSYRGDVQILGPILADALDRTVSRPPLASLP